MLESHFNFRQPVLSRRRIKHCEWLKVMTSDERNVENIRNEWTILVVRLQPWLQVADRGMICKERTWLVHTQAVQVSVGFHG